MNQGDAKNLKIPASISKLIERIAIQARPKKIVLFGSRARGNARENSDFDLCVIDKTCSESIWAKLVVDLEIEPWTLFKVDLVEFEKVSPEMQKNIKHEGLILYG